MQVCAECMRAAQYLGRVIEDNTKLRARVLDLLHELEETNAAFWQLAQDVRLDVVHVEVKEDFITQIFPAIDNEEGKGAA